MKELMRDSINNLWRNIWAKLRQSHVAEAAVRLLPLPSYWLVLIGAKLLMTTLLTFLLIREHGRTRLEDIAEVIASGGLIATALGAVLFWAAMARSQPWTSEFWPGLLLKARSRPFWSRALKGAAHGTLIGLAIVGTLLAVGSLEWAGYYTEVEDSLSGFLGLLSESLALATLVLSEELLLRGWLQRRLRDRLELRSNQSGQSLLSKSAALWVSVAVGALTFWATRALQFDLGLAQSATILLLWSVCGTMELGYGFGFVTSLLWLFHCGFGSPIWGVDITGFWILKPVPSSSVRWATGGSGGLLSSIALPLILSLELARTLRRSIKALPSDANRYIGSGS